MKFSKQFQLSALVFATALFGCTGKSGKPTVTIYTSTYKEVIALYEPKLKAKFPDLNIEWFQAGSEQVASRITAELAGGGTKADLLMTSDLFFCQELKSQGKLAAINADVLAGWPKNQIDDEQKYVITRFPMMVIAVNTKKLAADKRPKSFKDLLKPEYKDLLAMPSPLESGSALTATLFLYNRFGGDQYLKGLRKNNIISAGGNGSTYSRIKSGEKPVGIVLMENVLQDRELNKVDWVDYIVPEEGALPIPSPVAILQGSKQPEAAQKVLQWFLTAEAQDILIKGWVYSPMVGAKTPAGATPWAELKMQEWSLPVFKDWGSKRQAVKDEFQKTILTN